MLTVGINENVRISKADINEHGTLVLEYSEAGASSSKNGTDFLSSLNTTSEGTLTSSLSFIQFPYKMDEYTKTPEDVVKRIVTFAGKLNHILKQYMTEDKIQWDLHKGLPIDPNDMEVSFMQAMRNPEMVQKVYTNQVTQFVQMISPHLASGDLFRVKLRRQSKAKHYATLPDYPPFMEPMSVPREQSKLAFSKYEVDNKLNDGTPVEAPAADQPNAQQAEDVKKLFGN